MRRPIKKIVAPKVDYFVENKKEPHFSDIASLQQFMTERGKIFPRTRTGLTSKNQKRLTIAIKYARHLALLPFITRG